MDKVTAPATTAGEGTPNGKPAHASTELSYTNNYSFVFPTTRQPLPPQTAYQRFVHSLNKPDWTYEAFAQAWKDLPYLERKKWESEAEEEAIRLKNAQTEWEVNGGGEFWNKRVKNMIERGNVPIKVVGQEMRKFPNLVVNATAVRAMTNAVELFVATMARESYLTKSDPTQLRLVDVHRLIHEEDRCFGFLNEDFAHPDTLANYVDAPDSPLVKAVLPPSLAAVAAPTSTIKAPAAAAVQQQVQSLPVSSMISTSVTAKGKMVHRPKCSYNNVQKMYDAMKPGAVWNEEANKEFYYKEYQKMKDEHVIAEARWRSEYPDEYRELLEKRKADQNRAKKRRMQALEAANAANGIVPPATAAVAAPAEPLVSPQQPTAAAPGGTPVRSRTDLLTLSNAARSQAQITASASKTAAPPTILDVAGNAKPVTQQAATTQTSPTATKVVDDTGIPAPWKRVLVVNPNASKAAVSGDEYYFWNTETGETTWEPPFAVPAWKA